MMEWSNPKMLILTRLMKRMRQTAYQEVIGHALKLFLMSNY